MPCGASNRHGIRAARASDCRSRADAPTGITRRDPRRKAMPRRASDEARAGAYACPLSRRRASQSRPTIDLASTMRPSVAAATASRQGRRSSSRCSSSSGPRRSLVGRAEVGRQVEVHELGREAGRRPERAQEPPRSGPVAGLLLELARGGPSVLLDRCRRPGRCSPAFRRGSRASPGPRPRATGARAAPGPGRRGRGSRPRPGWPATSRGERVPSARSIVSMRNVR